MSQVVPSLSRPPWRSRELLRCIACATPLEGRDRCPGCGRDYPERDGVIEAIGPLSGRNRITEAFYSGRGWKRFRPWERGFLALQGGNRRARSRILNHLPAQATLRLLEVGIGDGDNLVFLPKSWEVLGIDHSRRRLNECRDRFPNMAGRLIRAEGEVIPLPDASVDATLCVGGFTMFSDHAAALREMRRVTKPDGPVVVADEHPWLCRMGVGHLVGLPKIDATWLRLLGLDREFIDMVFSLPQDLGAIAEEALPGIERHRIWNGLGYCFVHRGNAQSIRA